MARSKPKKVFYNRRYKLPAWGQLYAVWGIAALATLGVVFFTSVEIVPRDTAPSLTTTPNGFADGLYYELRDAEAGNEGEAILAYAKRLEKRHGYKFVEEKKYGCKVFRLEHGSPPRYGFVATVAAGKSQDTFHLLTFLDRIIAQNETAAIQAIITLPGKNCRSEEVLPAMASDTVSLPIALESGEIGQAYDSVFQFKNLKIRRHFEQAFFMRERTLWANTMAMLQHDAQHWLTLPVKSSWLESPAELMAQNPLVKHPLVAKIGASELIKPVGIYLTGDAELHRGGLIALFILLWFAALVPLANAIGTFRERTDIVSAATSSVLYGLSFFAYFLLIKTILHFAKTDFAVVLLAILLLPALFIPVSILQKNLLRAELNRPGLHILSQVFLTVTIFINPLIAFPGFLLLLIASGFSRAGIGSKILRLLLVAGIFAVFYAITRSPLGSFANFFTALLPGFSAAGIPKVLLLCLIGGNLVSLFFVARERN